MSIYKLKYIYAGDIIEGYEIIETKRKLA
jgi:hypothetical protein